MSVPPAKHYSMLLKTFKEQGVKIIHRKLKKAGGLYDPEKNMITVSSEYRDTLQGCAILLHEIVHYNQKRYNEHPEFFKLTGKEEFSEELFRKILDAEMEAVKKSYVMLKMFGIPFRPPELDGEGREKAISFWRDYYFPKNSCN
jgi:hypothetical protein